MNQPKISVIVPVYNAEKWLRRCVDSILAQTYTDFELLLVDDGSTDGSGAICDEYATLDARIRPFHKPNGGVSSARNLGLDNARGEWIAFCDADDYTFDCWLSNYQIDKYSDFDIVCQGFQSDKKLSFTDTENIEYHGFTYEGDNVGLLENLTKHEILGYLWCKLFRKNLIDELRLRFDNSLNFHEDEKFTIYFLINCNKAKAINLVGYFYHVPNWNNKYLSSAAHLNFYSEMFQHLTSIPNTLLSRRKYFRNYNGCFCYHFLKTSKSEKIEWCKNYRRLLKLDCKASPLYIIPKYCIYLDSTALFSSAILLAFLQTKKILWRK